MALSLLALLVSVESDALDPERRIDQYSVQRWSTEDGLPMDSVLSILLSQEGYLWLSTQEGLARFDGVHFEIFDRSNLLNLPHNRISGLAESPDGRLWIGSERGLLRLDPDGSTRVWGVETDLDVNDILVAQSGEIWVGTTDGLFRLPGPDVEAELEPVAFAGSANPRVIDLAETEGGKIWVGTRSGLLRLPDRKLWTEAEGLPSTSIEALHPARDGSLWIGTDRGIARLRDETLERPTAVGIEDLYVQAIHEDASGQVWLGTKNDGLLRLRGDELSRWSIDVGPIQVRAILEDPVGGLWLAAAAGAGLLRLSDGPVVAWGVSSGLSSDRVYSLLAEPDGVVWMGTFGGGLNRLEEGVITTLRQADGLPSDKIWSFCRDRAGGLWIGTYGDGLARMDEEGIETFRLHDEPDAQFVRAIAEDAAGRIWAGTRSGLFLRGDGGDRQWRRFTSSDGLPGSSVIALLAARDGRFFVGTESGAASWQGERFETIEQTRGKIIYALAEDDQGTLWLGTENEGLGRYDGEQVRFAGRAQGLHDDLVYAIALDGEGGAWLSSNRGIVGIELTQIEALFAGRGDDLSLRILGLGDGLPTYEMNGGANSSTARGADGRLWFPSPRGAVSVDPRRPESPTVEAPAAILQSVRVDQQPRSSGGEVQLEPGWRHLEIRWSAPFFLDPAELEFRYRLDGHDREWLLLPGGQRQLNYSGLPAGTYRLRLQAGFDGQNWGPEMTPLSLRVMAPWWYSPWVLGLSGLALGLIVLSAFSVQRRRYQQQRAIAAKERTVVRQLRELDLAKDQFLANTSHELRTPLYGIVGLAESLLEERLEEQGAGGDKTRQQLEQIASAGRRLGGLVGDILDFAQIRENRLELDLGGFKIHAIAELVLALAKPLADGSGLELINAVSDDLPPARADERRLQQILLNLLGNAIKFTERGSVKVSARHDSNRLWISVQDTGIGIPAEKIEAIFEAFEQGDASSARRFGGTGLGLSLSRRLVELHGGRLEVVSEAGVGSTFSFSLPVAGEHELRPQETGRSVSRLRPAPASRDETSPEMVLPALPTAENMESVHILVVDDEPIVRLLLEGQLEAEGHRVTAVDNGTAALDLLRDRELGIDLVLLDVMMPRLTGYEVCEKIRHELGVDELPILLLTAKDRLGDLAAGFAAGANDYLIKPVGREELVARLGLHLRMLQAHREKVLELEELRSFLPICASCKKVRDHDLWLEPEHYFHKNTGVVFTHGLCPTCHEGILTGASSRLQSKNRVVKSRTAKRQDQ